jgi:hypothetical protein
MTLSDAERVRDVLGDSGIAAHIADPRSGSTSGLGSQSIRVSVDNRRLDAARRAIASWRLGAQRTR